MKDRAFQSKYPKNNLLIFLYKSDKTNHPKDDTNGHHYFRIMSQNLCPKIELHKIYTINERIMSQKIRYKKSLMKP